MAKGIDIFLWRVDEVYAELGWHDSETTERDRHLWSLIKIWLNMYDGHHDLADQRLNALLRVNKQLEKEKIK